LRETMRRWQAGLEGMDQRIGPMMVPPADWAAIVWTCGPDRAKMPCRPIGEVGMDAELNPAQRLHALGQNLWLDSICRNTPEAKWMKGHL
jgi:hypothetical protein